jgi:hypothetical protein
VGVLRVAATRLLADLERECRRMLLIVVTCRDAAPASTSCERGLLSFRQFVRVFTTATGVVPEWVGLVASTWRKGQ